MKIEKVYKTEEGKFLIQVSLIISSWGSEKDFKYNIFTSFIPKGKRKPDSDKDQTNKLPEIILMEAKLMFWNAIMPK
jgi:hypothetical protein